MPKQIDPKVGEILKKYGYDKSAVWDCHGTWVIYHYVLEDIASRMDIEFQSPHVCCSDIGNVAICVHGELDIILENNEVKTKIEWSIGEASPKNNKNSYPWAMAEKRAKDRVILKLIGLHGLVYSEQEADEFKEERPDNVKGSVSKAKEVMKKFEADVFACEDNGALDQFMKSQTKLTARFKEVIPEYWSSFEDDLIEKRKKLKENENAE